MAKFIKEVTKEVLDVESIKKAVALNKAMCIKTPRMVISHVTERELAVCLGFYSVAVTRMGEDLVRSRTFMGCPIDYNNSLSFGEVLFTVEL